ncbi:MAG: ATP-binding protein [Acidobacteriota bacterium]
MPISRSPAPSSSTTRRLGVAAAVFGLFVVFDILLFAFLIFDSLSQRELEKVLLEAREEAQPIAAELEARAAQLGGDDLFVVVSVAQETKTYIDSVLSQRQLVSSVEIRDRSGTVVYQQSEEEDLPIEQSLPRVEVGPSADLPNLPPAIQEEVEVPIGDLGTLVIGLSDEEVRTRIGVLRRDLIRQTSIVGGVTLLLLLVAIAGFVHLVKRSRALEEQAGESERMAYVGTLASGLAHEIRSPLNSLSLNMQMLEEEAREEGGTAAQRRLLAITRDELGRLERLATDFLTYARPRPTEVANEPLGDLLRRAVGVLGGELAAQGVDLEAGDLTGGALVQVDGGQIVQLLLNLVQNAAAATEEREDRRVELEARIDGGQAVLEVRDNGRGIAAEDQERIFELFYSKRKGGTGLGLAIVQRIAETHGATIELESAPGDGTSVRIRFPREALARAR